MASWLRRAMWLGLACGVAVGAAPVRGAPVNWAQTYYDAGHSGYNPKEATLSTANVSGLQLLWGQGVAGGVTSFVLDAGTIYAQGQGTTVPVLAAIDAATGSTLWTITTSYDAFTNGGTVATGGKLVFAGCSFTDPGGSTSYDAVCGYKKSNGALVWHFANPCNCLPEAALFAPLVYADGAVYFGYANGGAGGTEYLVAADAKTGSVLWTHVTGGPNTMGSAAPVVGNGMVYFTCGGNGFSGVCAVSQTDGSLLWTANFGTGTMGLTLAKNVLYVNAGYAGEVAALNATTGTSLWSFAMNSSADPVSVAKNVVYATGSDGYVHALKASTGTQKWSLYLASESSVSLANGVLYDTQQGANNPATAAYDAATGSLLWSSPLPASTLHPPQIVANGTLYITDAACGAVCAYGLTGGAAVPKRQ